MSARFLAAPTLQTPRECAIDDHQPSTRARLATLVRRADADLAEAALLVDAEAIRDLDVDVALLRVDALGDAFVTWWQANDELSGPRALQRFMNHEQGFTGDREDYRRADNALLTHVLDRRRGLPILLSVVYAAVARRAGLPAWGIAQPGHFYLGVGEASHPVVLDPFDDGREVSTDDLAERLRVATAGRVPFTRAHLRPAGPAMTIRRILNNLTRTYTDQGRVTEALWTVELKLVLPNAIPDDHKARAELLSHLGRYRDAAEGFERYVELSPDGGDAADIRARAIRARAKLN